MKQAIISAWLLLASTTVLFAQDTSPKSFLVGGSLRIISSNNNNNITVNGVPASNSEGRQFGFSINPYSGKYLNDKWIIGLGLGLEWEYSKSVGLISGNESTITRMGISPYFFARYLLNPGDKLVVQLSPSASFNYAEIVSDSGSNVKTTLYSAGIGIGPLFSYSLSDRVNLIGSFGSLSFLTGTSNVKESGSKSNFNNFNLNLNIRSIGMGLEINL
mgnify:CR=1 FL=1